MSVIKFDKWDARAIFVQIMVSSPVERITIVKELRSLFGAGLKEAKDMLENGALFPNTPEGNVAAVSYMGQISNLNARNLLPGFVGFTVGMWEAPYRQEPYRWGPNNF